jgi:hypothetical protein
MRLRLIAVMVTGIFLIASCTSSTTTATDSPVADTTEPSQPTTTEPTRETLPDATSSVELRDNSLTSGLSERVQSAITKWETDWSHSIIDLAELRLGIASVDPRDIIRPIDGPILADLATTATWVDDREPGALVEVNGKRRFYPLSILTRHEIVNDTLGDVPIAVTYCPLCNTAATYDRRVGDQVLRLGVSGLLRNSDMVIWDTATTSLWQQITGEAIVGSFAGTRLERISTGIVSLGEVRGNFPDATSLDRDQGHGFRYQVNGYAGYSSEPAPISGFADAPTDERLQALERVVGVTINDETKAYGFPTLQEIRVVNDELGGEPIAVLWGGNTLDALDATFIPDSRSVGTGVAYFATVEGQKLTFAAKGDDTFTDTETGTTWTLLGAALEGPLTGAQLEFAPHSNEFWFAFAFFFAGADLYEIS